MTIATAGPRVDPRARRTRQLLHQALLDLAREHALDEISVGDIAERATVSRATFYLHYRDRDDLLADVIDTMIVTEASLAAGTDIPERVTERTPPPAYIIDFFAVLDRDAGFYRQVLGPDGSARVAYEMRERLQTALVELIRHHTGNRARVAADDVHAAWVAGALLGVITHWLGQPRRSSPRKVATDVWRLAVQPLMRRT